EGAAPEEAPPVPARPGRGRSRPVRLRPARRGRVPAAPYPQPPDPYGRRLKIPLGTLGYLGKLRGAGTPAKQPREEAQARGRQRARHPSPVPPERDGGSRGAAVPPEAAPVPAPWERHPGARRRRGGAAPAPCGGRPNHKGRPT